MTIRTPPPQFSDGLMRFLRDERATTAIEYALIASVISIAIVGAATSLGSTLTENYFDKIAAAFD